MTASNLYDKYKLYENLNIMEREISAITRGVIKAVYSGYEENYLENYPEMEFLHNLRPEELQYLNRHQQHIPFLDPESHIHLFLSRKIIEVCNLDLRTAKEEAVIPFFLHIYRKEMMQIDAEYFQNLALKTKSEFDIETARINACKRIIRKYSI